MVTACDMGGRPKTPPRRQGKGFSANLASSKIEEKNTENTKRESSALQNENSDKPTNKDRTRKRKKKKKKRLQTPKPTPQPLNNPSEPPPTHQPKPPVKPPSRAPLSQASRSSTGLAGQPSPRNRQLAPRSPEARGFRSRGFRSRGDIGGEAEIRAVQKKEKRKEKKRGAKGKDLQTSVHIYIYMLYIYIYVYWCISFRLLVEARHPEKERKPKKIDHPWGGSPLACRTLRRTPLSRGIRITELLSPTGCIGSVYEFGLIVSKGIIHTWY